MAILAAALLVACHGHPPEKAQERPALTVEVVSPARETWPDVLVASGDVAAWQEAVIGTEVSGIRLDEVLVNVGDVVRKGQVLARYNEDTLRADLARLDAAVAEAQANDTKAKAEVVRADRLAAADAMAAQAVQNFHAQAQVAAAQLASARAQRDAQALKLRYARVVAPDDGVISARSATVGAVSGMGTELFRLVRQNRLEWHAEVPAEGLARLAAGGKVEVQIANGSIVTGRLRQVSPTVNTGTRNGIAYVDLPANSGLTAGMYVTGRFTLVARDALTIPESAVVLRDGNRYLMKVDEQQRVHEVKVATGRREREAIEILGGNVTPSDRFVKSGGAFVADGDLVRVVTSAAPAAP